MGGSPIGNQISPVLSSIAVCAVEINWHRTFHQWIASHKFFATRYVDNRFLICKSDDINSKAFQRFLHLEFYGLPVELEVVDDTILLGFEVDPVQFQVRYILPDKSHQFRSPYSAGSDTLNLSGFKSRKHLIKSYAFPPEVAKLQISQLASLYIEKG